MTSIFHLTRCVPHDFMGIGGYRATGGRSTLTYAWSPLDTPGLSIMPGSLGEKTLSRSRVEHGSSGANRNLSGHFAAKSLACPVGSYPLDERGLQKLGLLQNLKRERTIVRQTHSLSRNTELRSFFPLRVPEFAGSPGPPGEPRDIVFANC